MGLDVVAFSHAKYLGDDIEDETMSDKLYVSRCDGQEDVMEGFYDSTARSEYYSFRVGSYCWAGAWDGHLCYAIHGIPKSIIEKNPNKFRGSAFYELVFAYEAIGPKDSAKLARDFAEHSKRVREYIKAPVSEDPVVEELLGMKMGGLESPIDSRRFLKTYRNWQKAFELGAQSGIVILC